MDTKQTITRPAVMQVLRDYWSEYKRYPLYSALAFLTPALGNIFVFFIPPLIIARLINIFSEQGEIPLTTLVFHVALFGGLWLVGEVLWRIGFAFVIKLETEGIKNLSARAFERLVARDYVFFTNNFVGTLTKKTLAFSRSFEIFTDVLSFSVVLHFFPLIFAMIVLWQYSPLIPLVLLIAIGCAVVIVMPIIRRRSELVAMRHDASSRVAGRLSDVASNIMAVKSFAKEAQEYSRYVEYIGVYARAFKRASDYHNLRLDTVISPMYVLTNVFGLIMAIVLVQRLNLSPGVIVVVFTYYAQISRVFWDINKVYRNIESSISEAAEFTQLCLLTPGVVDAVDADELPAVDARRIEFNAVHFTYEGGNGRSFLDDFNLSIQPGQKVGLVGPSGGGKTTITKLLLRFLDLQSGSITIEGKDIAKVTQYSLRKAIAYVPQEPLLFHRSLRENIAYGNAKATEEEILEAAKIAHAHEFIVELSHGYDTLVGERGVKLSGGQRQRVAIARALLKQASILVLDEATSALDSESEKYIQSGLRELMKGKTALVIAHRLSTIKHLDRIIVLDKGKIVQDGTHEQLIRKPGVYATLWSHQSGEFLGES